MTNPPYSNRSGRPPRSALKPCPAQPTSARFVSTRARTFASACGRQIAASHARSSKTLNLTPDFPQVFLSFELGLRKPERAAFEAIAAAIGVPLNRIRFFDDTPASVEGARAIGMPAVLVRSPADVVTALAAL
jgi:beta-phosphoglucomutase-like phosphatase (HAD superfamily)